MQGKQMIRKQMREYLGKQTAMERQQKSAEIFRKVISLPQWKQATSIGITIAQTFEVETREIIRKGWEEGKIVCVPKCVPITREIHFYQITSFEQLEKGYFDLYEPNVEITKKIKKKDIQCLFVPGVAFSEQGERLGFGGGYYDRFLVKYKGEVITLSFDGQIISHIPTNEYDRDIPMIITEKRIIINGK